MTTGFVIWDKLWKGSAILLNIYKSTFASILFLVVSIMTIDHLSNVKEISNLELVKLMVWIVNPFRLYSWHRYL